MAFVPIFLVAILLMFFYLKSQARSLQSTFDVLYELGREQSFTSVLDQLPDSVIIANTTGLEYINK
jgi:hypothetical protein